LKSSGLLSLRGLAAFPAGRIGKATESRSHPEKVRVTMKMILKVRPPWFYNGLSSSNTSRTDTQIADISPE
jgi:hypothetical protein